MLLSYNSVLSEPSLLTKLNPELENDILVVGSRFNLIHVCSEGTEPPSTITSPCSLDFPRSVP